MIKKFFNGDIGVVAQVDTEERTLTVIFDGSPVGYEIDELDELVLAYAVPVAALPLNEKLRYV